MDHQRTAEYRGRADMVQTGTRSMRPGSPDFIFGVYYFDLVSRITSCQERGMTSCLTDFQCQRKSYRELGCQIKVNTY
jgi:hypothetical protein